MHINHRILVPASRLNDQKALMETIYKQVLHCSALEIPQPELVITGEKEPLKLLFELNFCMELHREAQNRRLKEVFYRPDGVLEKTLLLPLGTHKAYYHFFSLEDGCNQIKKKHIKRVKAAPENWAVILLERCG